VQASSFLLNVSAHVAVKFSHEITVTIYNHDSVNPLVARLIESEYREGSFICEAKGYPIAHFVGWRAMNGSSITDTELTYLSSGTSEFESTIIASLPLHAVNCTSGGGISCVFDNGNGSYRVESPMMDCPTSMYDSTIIMQSHDYYVQLNL
jgi:hypothetical protein